MAVSVIFINFWYPADTSGKRPETGCKKAGISVASLPGIKIKKFVIYRVNQSKPSWSYLVWMVCNGGDAAKVAELHLAPVVQQQVLQLHIPNNNMNTVFIKRFIKITSLSKKIMCDCYADSI